ncbi:hypothetical protein Tco_1556025 [Tanacetum coccineum]
MRNGYGISDLLDMVYRTYWVQRTKPIGYGVLRSSGMAYWALGYGVSALLVQCFIHLRYGVSGYSDTAYGLIGYGELAENVFLMVFDQSIIYGVSVDVDTTYSSKSGNGLKFLKVFRYTYASRMIRRIDVRISDFLKLFVYASKHVLFSIIFQILDNYCNS